MLTQVVFRIQFVKHPGLVSLVREVGTNGIQVLHDGRRVFLFLRLHDFPQDMDESEGKPCGLTCVVLVFIFLVAWVEASCTLAVLTSDHRLLGKKVPSVCSIALAGVTNFFPILELASCRSRCERTGRPARAIDARRRGLLP